MLNRYGFEDIRVRHFGTFAKIEVNLSDLEKLDKVMDLVVKEMKDIGFNQIEIDQEGFVSGKMNRVLHSLDLKKG